MTTERTLHQLTDEGRRLVGQSFLKGETSLSDEDVAEYVEPLAGDQTADLDYIDSRVEEVLTEYSEFDTAIDGALAKDIHQGLDITRRTAGNPGLWHWLAVVRYPDLVRYRWEYRSEEAMREKFLGAGSDLYSNAIHRLWWIAELTSQGDNYEITNAVFANQTMVNKVFDRWFARYRPAVIAMCDELADEPSRVIDDVTRRFNHTLTNVQLEALSERDARQLIQRLINEAK
ncbi:DUF6339 family protein [Salarchaeum sp. III]|uniref:DUF6339 family protein n=1 Tax=Salarchaeum sp. III TaxID=3107927 RepID=UPI002ED7E132